MHSYDSDNNNYHEFYETNYNFEGDDDDLFLRCDDDLFVDNAENSLSDYNKEKCD
jgi:hypothetical protein